VLVEIARELPELGADTLTKVFNRRMGREVSDNSVRYALVSMGWRRMERPPASPLAEAPEGKDAPRYQERHRTEGPPERSVRYPSDITDAEWLLVEPWLRGARGPLPDDEQLRAKFNAILYVARTGCPWRYLPHDFPPWNTVAKTFYRWVKRGVWTKIEDVLRREIRVRAGREPEASAAIVDSQSVKTTEKGGSRATMRARKPREESDISSLTPSGS
jgi:transposase